MDRTIKITIDQLGNPTVEAVGFAGVGCADATRAIEKALGGDMGSSRTLKGDYYQLGDENEQQGQEVRW